MLPVMSDVIEEKVAKKENSEKNQIFLLTIIKGCGIIE
jgi:hypothetical protein